MIQLFGEDARTVPDWFKRRLRDIDPALVCYFNPFRQVFCIDRCIKGSDCLSLAHVECEKANVMLFPHIGEAAIEKLKSMDAWAKTGGKDESALQRFRRGHEIAKEEHDAKVSEEIREGFHEHMVDDRAQINKALHLIQQHDIARPHERG